MRRWGTWILALASASLTTLVLVGCSSGPERPILNQFFAASRLRDNTTLANFSTVSFRPGRAGNGVELRHRERDTRAAQNH